jgi:hypothetical protein
MIERASRDANVWLKDLATLESPQALADAGKGGVDDWATESLPAARAAYVVPELGVVSSRAGSWGHARLPARWYLASGKRLADQCDVATELLGAETRGNEETVGYRHRAWQPPRFAR